MKSYIPFLPEFATFFVRKMLLTRSRRSYARNNSDCEGYTKAFTLIELLVSISIIGILVTIGIASFATINKQTHDAKRKSDIEQVRSALEMYRSDMKYYPSGGCASSSCTAVDVQTIATDIVDYMAAIPTDPNKVQKYWYRATTLVNGLYYGYCLSANLEGAVPTDTCVPDGEYNWGVSNP